MNCRKSKTLTSHASIKTRTHQNACYTKMNKTFLQRMSFSRMFIHFQFISKTIVNQVNNSSVFFICCCIARNMLAHSELRLFDNPWCRSIFWCFEVNISFAPAFAHDKQTYGAWALNYWINLVIFQMRWVATTGQIERWIKSDRNKWMYCNSMSLSIW